MSSAGYGLVYVDSCNSVGRDSVSVICDSDCPGCSGCSSLINCWEILTACVSGCPGCSGCSDCPGCPGCLCCPSCLGCPCVVFSFIRHCYIFICIYIFIIS